MKMYGFLLLALGSLVACGSADKGASTDTDAADTDAVDTDVTVDTDVAADTDVAVDTDTETDDDTNPPAGVARVRFAGARAVYLGQSLVSVTALLDGEPISAGFDAGVAASDYGWFYPGSDDAVELPAGEHELSLTAVYSAPPCPECPPADVEGSTTYRLDLQAGAELYVNLWVSPPGEFGVATNIWSVDDTRARSGGAAVRLVGGPVPQQPRWMEELTIAVATDGCVSRSEVVVSPLWGATQLVGVPTGDTGEAWVGLAYTNPFGPTATSWYELPDRPAGEILDVFTGTMSTAPATEGEGLPVVYGEMTWPLCPAGPS